MEAWWTAQDASTRDECRGWLARFLDEYEPSAAQRAYRAELWKERAFRRLFTDPQFRYELIHFACHCDPGEHSKFHSRLKFTVGGEPVCLDVGLMSSGLRRRGTWNMESPGPLVFLNACGPAEQSPSYEPPGFPENWIDGQGAVAVTATLCPVPDYFAHRFALTFYDFLLDSTHRQRNNPNHSIAEALLATRRYFIQEFAIRSALHMYSTGWGTHAFSPQTIA